MPIAGLVRLRKHQFGRQSAFGTIKNPVVRAYPFSGTPDVNLNWTDPEAEVGSLDPVAPPFRTSPDVTAPLTDSALAYNNLPLLLSGFFGDGVTPTGGGPAKTWAYAPASTTPDDIDVFTYEFGDDVVTDWFQLADGLLEGFEISGPDGLGPLSTSMTWRFGNARSTGSTDSPASGTVPSPSLDVSVDDKIVYLKDGAIYIASDPYDLASSQISDALHSFVLRFSGDVDQKRYANGTQSFDVQAYARASRLIELECTFAKTADTVGTGSEADAWFSDDAVNRYVRLVFTSTSFAEGAIPYSFVLTMPMRYYTRAEGESGGNTVVVLTGRAFYDPGLFDGVFEATVVNTLASADL